MTVFKRIDHTEIIPRDFERAINFYTDVLGFKVRTRQKVSAPPMEEVAYLDLNGTTVEMLSVTPVAPATADPWRPGYRAIALEVDDMDQAVKYLKGKGVDITWGPVTLGTSKRAEIKDPDGLSIELRQW